MQIRIFCLLTSLFLYLPSILLADFPIEIYLVRHGQTDSNLFDKSQSVYTPLNAVGEKQADDLGKLLALENISHIFSSDYLRAQQTAEIILKNLGRDIPIECSRMLKEGDAGNWKDKSPSEKFKLRREYRLHCEPTKEAWVSFKGDGSIESYEEMYFRLKNFLEEKVAPKAQSIPDNSSVVLVSHGMMIISTLYHHLEYDPKLGFGIENCGWLKLLLKEDGSLELVDQDKVRSFPFP